MCTSILEGMGGVGVVFVFGRGFRIGGRIAAFFGKTARGTYVMGGAGIQYIYYRISWRMML